MRPEKCPQKPYSRQEIYDRVKQHFLVEGYPRSAEGGLCFYRGTGCAVGCLMTLEDALVFDGNPYSGKGTQIESVKKNEPDIYKKYFHNGDLGFLSALQQWHDNEYLDVDVLNEIVEEYGLNK
jgi:hypothetical protein